MSGGGPAAHQRVGGPGGVSAPGSLQAAAAGAQPPGGPATHPHQREPGRRALQPEGRLKEDPLQTNLSGPREEFNRPSAGTQLRVFKH